MWKIRPPKFRIRLPVLTAAEKSALGILMGLLAAGAAMRAWERSGVAMGTVDDWDSLRELVIRAPKPGSTYPCALEPERSSEKNGFLRTGSGKQAKKKSTNAGKKSGPARPLDMNLATESQWTSLPGVGPSTARAIVAYRAAQGKFTAPEELMRVKGIGPKKFAALQKFIRVSPPPVQSPPTDSNP